MAMGVTKVVISYVVNEDAAKAMVHEIESTGGTAMAVHADVSQADQVKNMFEQMVDAYGSIDILVNSAGIQRDATFLDMTVKQWNQVLNVNLTWKFFCAQEAAREFVQRRLFLRFPVPRVKFSVSHLSMK